MKLSTASTISHVACLLCMCLNLTQAFLPMPGAARDIFILSRTGALATPRFVHALGERLNRGAPLKAEKEGDTEKDSEPMDLDLEQMFEVFEAADKEVSDEVVGKKSSDTKGSSSGSDNKGPDVGDMISSFFGGGKK